MTVAVVVTVMIVGAQTWEKWATKWLTPGPWVVVSLMDLRTPAITDLVKGPAIPIRRIFAAPTSFDRILVFLW